MDPTVAFLWSKYGPARMSLSATAPSPSEWAIYLLEAGFDSEAIRWLTDPDPPLGMQERLIKQVLSEIDRDDLLDRERLKNAFEAESIADYFSGQIDGWALIRLGCQLFGDDQWHSSRRSGRDFWIRVGADADEHGGQGICLEYHFRGNDFDEVLKQAIRESNRPLPVGVTRISRK